MPIKKTILFFWRMDSLYRPVWDHWDDKAFALAITKDPIFKVVLRPIFYIKVRPHQYVENEKVSLLADWHKESKIHTAHF